MRIRTFTIALALAAGTQSAPAQQVVPLGDTDVLLEGRAQDVFRVGESEAREEEQFARVAATAFDEADNLYVLDAQNNRVVMFDASGTYVRTIGRKGEGPGELRFPNALAVAHDGHVVVMDPGNRALVVYRRDGKYVRNLPLDHNLTGRTRFMTPHPQGGVVLALSPGLSIRNGVPEADTSGIRIFWFRSLAEGARPTLLMTVPEPREETRIEGSPASGTVRMMRRPPPAFTPTLHLALSGEGALVFNNSAQYELNVLDADGRVARKLQRPFQPRRVTEADKEAERKRQAEVIVTSGNRVMVGGAAGAAGRMVEASQEQLQRLREEGLRNLEFAETVPVILGLYSDPAGRIWVLRSGVSPGKPALIDVIGANGRYVGTVQGEQLPSSVSRSGLAAYVGMNELDVPVVTVRRLPQNRRG